MSRWEIPVGWLMALVLIAAIIGALWFLTESVAVLLWGWRC